MNNMAKINKNKVIHSKKKTILSLKNKYNLKNCCVILNRIDFTKVKYVHNFNVKIANQKLQINGQEFDQISENKYHITMKINSSDEVVVEQCNFVQKPLDVKSNVKQIPKSLNQITNEAWARCKKEKKLNGVVLNVNEPVLAKMKGYQPWAGNIISFTKNKKSAKVYFYGTNNNGSVLESEIVRFKDAETVIRLLLLRNLFGFKRGVIEVEELLGIPPELSVTEEQGCLMNE